MDISLIKSEESTILRPISIHGMLWLQTHFENEHWEAISAQRVKISNLEVNNLFEDALNAGLKLNFVPTALNSEKF